MAAPQLALLHLALGDHIVEQHVHNLDVVNWAIGAHPVRAVGMGGRQVRTGPEYGHIFDHFAVDYEYPNGVHVLSMCRQIDGCENNVSEAVVGTKGRWHEPAAIAFEGASQWRYRVRGKEVNPYVQEHIDLIASIRDGKPLNELQTRRREHPDGDHGPDVGLHRQGRDLGRGAQVQART